MNESRCIIFILLIIICILVKKIYSIKCDYSDLIEKIDQLSLTEI